jgi:hypothetical protein
MSVARITKPEGKNMMVGAHIKSVLLDARRDREDSTGEFGHFR